MDRRRHECVSWVSVATLSQRDDTSKRLTLNRFDGEDVMLHVGEWRDAHGDDHDLIDIDGDARIIGGVFLTMDEAAKLCNKLRMFLATYQDDDMDP